MVVKKATNALMINDPSDNREVNEKHCLVQLEHYTRF